MTLCDAPFKVVGLLFEKPNCLPFVHILVFIAGVLPLAASAGPDSLEANGDPCYLFTYDAEYFEFDLRLQLRDDKTVHFSVPIDYIEDQWLYPFGGEITAKLFQVGTELFEPVSRLESHNRNKAGIWNWAHFTVQSLVPLEVLVLKNVRSASGELHESITDLQLLPAEFDMLKVNHSLKTYSKTTYISKTVDGEITDVFLCSQLEQGPFPICSQYFEYDDITVKVTFRQSELSNWQHLRSNLIQFLTCATSE